MMPRWLRSGRVLTGLVLLCTVLAVAALAPLLAPNDPEAQNLALILAPLRLGGQFPVGTDGLGRCVLSRLLHGALPTLAEAAVAAALALLIAGMLASAVFCLGGWAGRLVDAALTLWSTFPPLVLALLLAAALGAWPVLAVALVDGARLCRDLRREAEAIAVRGHVAAARLAGFSPAQVWWRELMPALLPLLAPLFVLESALALAALVALDLFGFGAGATWGALIGEAFAVVATAPLQLLLPIGAVAAASAGCVLLADGLRRTVGLRLIGGVG